MDSFSVENSEGVTTIRFLRDLGLEEILAIVDVIAEKEKGNRRLWDIREHFHLNTAEIRTLAKRGRILWPNAARVAYCVSNDVTFGLLRMFEVFREQDNYQTRVFRDEQVARQWLKDWVE